MSSMSGPGNPRAPNVGQSPYQDQLINFCRSSGIRPPNWQVVSDRRGGRTAWSCTVNVQGQHIQARFWYDGQYVNNAREDAAQMALHRYGQLSVPGVPQSPPTQQQQPPQPQQPQPQQQQTPQQSPQQSAQQSAQQQRFYGVIGS